MRADGAMALLAHQGGWDEIALVAGPLAAFGLVLYLANRRANAKLAKRSGSPADSLQAPDDAPPA